jgi:hypothetical protein
MDATILQGNFSIASLCFKTDMMTVVERVELMERQRNNANTVINNEITAFSSVIQVCVRYSLT